MNHQKVIAEITQNLITLLSRKPDATDWVHHGGPGVDLVERIMSNINMVETGHMQVADETTQFNLVEKACRLKQYGMLVDIWKELISIHRNDSDMVRRWALSFEVIEYLLNSSSSDNPAYIEFGSNISGDGHPAATVGEIEKTINSVKAAFLSMTKQTNHTATKTRSWKIVTRLLKTNPILQRTLLKEVLHKDIFAIIDDPYLTPTLRGVRLLNIFDQLIAGLPVEKEKEQVVANDNTKTLDTTFDFHREELELHGISLFNEFSEFASFRQIWESNTETVAKKLWYFANMVNKVKRAIVIIEKSVNPLTVEILSRYLSEHLEMDERQIKANIDATPFSLLNKSTKETEVKNKEQYIQFSGTSHLLGAVRTHNDLETEKETLLTMVKNCRTPADTEIIRQFIHRAKNQKELVKVILNQLQQQHFDSAVPGVRGVIIDKVLADAITINNQQPSGSIYAAGVQVRDPAPVAEKPKAEGLAPETEKALNENIPALMESLLKALPNSFKEGFVMSKTDKDALAGLVNLLKEVDARLFPELSARNGTDESLIGSGKSPNLLDALVSGNHDLSSQMAFINSLNCNCSPRLYMVGGRPQTNDPLTNNGPKTNPYAQPTPQQIVNVYAAGNNNTPERAMTIKGVTTVETIETEEGITFTITRNTATKLLTISASVFHNPFVNGIFEDDAAEYIVNQFVKGIEAGYPFRAANAAVAKMQVPSLDTFSYGFGVTPGYSNW